VEVVTRGGRRNSGYKYALQIKGTVDPWRVTHFKGRRVTRGKKKSLGKNERRHSNEGRRVTEIVGAGFKIMQSGFAKERGKGRGKNTMKEGRGGTQQTQGGDKRNTNSRRIRKGGEGLSFRNFFMNTT